jgi:hypothetical protein
MRSRPHGRKHTLALWMLVAVADGMIIVNAAGVAAQLLIALAVAMLAGLVVTVRLVTRRGSRQPAVTRGVRSWQLARAQTEGQGWRESCA